MVHAMQNGVGPRDKKRSALRNERQQVKQAFGERRKNEHPVGTVTVQEERLEKKRKEPVSEKEDQNWHVNVRFRCIVSRLEHYDDSRSALDFQTDSLLF